MTEQSLLLGRLGGATRASVRSTDTFEPASLLKTFHHFHAMRKVALGNDSLGNAVIFPDGGDTVCPSPDDPLNAQLLQETLRRMMEDSSNPATEAIRQWYGSAAIEATETALEHVIGCFRNSTRNQTTLADLRTLHDAAVSGLLGGIVSQFHSLMLQNYADFPAIVRGELATSILSIAERDQFEALAHAAGKGGSYTCNDALNEGVFRSRGAYFRVPFKEGCDIVDRAYFAGAWINDAPSDSGGVASDNCDAGMESLFAVAFVRPSGAGRPPTAFHAPATSTGTVSWMAQTSASCLPSGAPAPRDASRTSTAMAMWTGPISAGSLRCGARVPVDDRGRRRNSPNEGPASTLGALFFRDDRHDTEKLSSGFAAPIDSTRAWSRHLL